MSSRPLHLKGILAPVHCIQSQSEYAGPSMCHCVLVSYEIVRHFPPSSILVEMVCLRTRKSVYIWPFEWPLKGREYAIQDSYVDMKETTANVLFFFFFLSLIQGTHVRDFITHS